MTVTIVSPRVAFRSNRVARLEQKESSPYYGVLTEYRLLVLQRMPSVLQSTRYSVEFLGSSQLLMCARARAHQWLPPPIYPIDSCHWRMILLCTLYHAPMCQNSVYLHAAKHKVESFFVSPANSPPTTQPSQLGIRGLLLIA